MDFDKLFSDLVSSNVDKQISALDTALEIAETLAKRSVQGLQNSSNNLFVAERIFKMGTITIAPLEELLVTSSSMEVKILASMVLLDLGSVVGIPYLLDAIGNNEDFACLAAQKLANARVVEASNRIIARLNKANLKELDTIVSLLLSLKKLDVKLPPNLVTRFSNSKVPWQIRTLIDCDSEDII